MAEKPIYHIELLLPGPRPLAPRLPSPTPPKATPPSQPSPIMPTTPPPSETALPPEATSPVIHVPRPPPTVITPPPRTLGPPLPAREIPPPLPPKITPPSQPSPPPPGITPTPPPATYPPSPFPSQPTTEQINQVVQFAINLFEHGFPAYRDALYNLYKQAYPDAYAILKPSLTYKFSGSGEDTVLNVNITALGISSGLLASYDFGHDVVLAWWYNNDPAGAVSDILNNIYLNAYQRLGLPTLAPGETPKYAPPPPPPDIAFAKIHVVDIANKPIADALVSLGTGKQLNALTDYTGTAILIVPAGNYIATITKQGYATFASPITLYPGLIVEATAKLAQAPPPLQEIFTLIIQVIDDLKSTPIPNVNITVDSHSGITDSTGRVTFNLPRGTYTVSASASGYNPASRTIDLISNKIITISLTPIAPPTPTPAPPPVTPPPTPTTPTPTPTAPMPAFPLSLLDLLLLPIEIPLYILQALLSQIPKP